MTITKMQSMSYQSSLTHIQLRLFGLMMSGHTIKQIAQLSEISEETVKYHLKRVFFKLGACSRAHAVAIAANRGLISRNEVPAEMRAALRSSLTPMQLHVLRMMAAGYKNQQVARLVGISEDTVKYHLKRVFSKLGARSSAHAVAIAAALGLMPREEVSGRQMAA